jgi:hypothetical protein
VTVHTDTGGDEIYDPTAFNPGGPPGISAFELNKIGQGIREAQLQARAAVVAAAGAVVTARTASFLTIGV